MSCAALSQEPPAAAPSFAELEAVGAKIGEIRILPQNIFDTEDTKEDNLLFRGANALHIVTRKGVVERALLFKSGDPISVRLIEETERVLLKTGYIYEAQFRPVDYKEGVVDIEVLTRDTWTIDLNISAGRSGDSNTSSFGISEFNLLGTGITVSYARSNDVDRSSNEFRIKDDRAFGGWTSVNYSRALNSDGKREAASIAQPFYALDTRWSAGVSAAKDDRIDAIYNAGNVASEYRHRQNLAEVVGGWSQGRVDGWVRRYSIGASYQDDAYALEPGRVAPAQLPPDEKLVGPFFRLEVIEDQFEKKQNFRQIGRPEFLNLGLHSTLQIGRAATGFGSSHDAWLYSASVSHGFEPTPEHTLIASGAISGQYTGGQVQRQRLGGLAEYYLRQNRRWTFYAFASGDVLTNPGPSDTLYLGGDIGLRGYPLRYQSGDRRALFTVEERVYTDLYWYRLFRVGGAAFFDVGRAWGGNNINAANPGWLSDLGLGLRIFSVRAASNNVIHLDVAFPLDPEGNIKKVQFLVKVKTSF